MEGYIPRFFAPPDQSYFLFGPRGTGKTTFLQHQYTQHLQAWNAYHNDRFDLYFWRSRGGVEVDFILYGKQGLYAIEVKNSDRIRPQDLRPLQAFHSDYPQSKTLFLYRGSERLLRQDILCLPCEEFLNSLRPGSGLFSE